MTRECDGGSNKDGEFVIPRHCLLSSEQAADQAVKKVFSILGVDIDKPESVEEFRKDLRFGGRMRKYADHSALVMVGLVSAGFIWALYEGVISKVKQVISG